MTTIAYRDGVMAADSRASYGDFVVPAGTRKLFRLKNGSVAAVTGSEPIWRAILNWLDTDRTEPQPNPQISDSRGTIIVMNAAGEIEVFEDGFSYPETSSFMAYGSGQPVALGALYSGASAEEAVRIATLVDKHSGGDVQTMRPTVQIKLEAVA